MPAVEHEWYVEAAEVSRSYRNGTAAALEAVSDLCLEALFGAVALAEERVRPVYGRR
jgi:hypothetical protein